jgi:hypothetical protein
MEFDQLIEKLAKWASLFYKYEFDVKHWIRIINKHEDRLSKNSNSKVLDSIITCWHGDIDLTTMSS